MPDGAYEVTWHAQTVERARDLAKRRGYPRLRLRAGCYVIGGEIPWRHFMDNVSVEDAALAVFALEAME